MAWLEQTIQRLKNGRVYQEKNIRRFYSNISSIHFESEIDSGIFDSEIDMSLVRINNAQLDGWQITQNGWHYALGQPAGKSDGWVGFGGRKGQNWIQFRLAQVGYLHYPTRTWNDIGGAPNYDRANLENVVVPKTIGPNDDVVNYRSDITWNDIWNTPGGGTIDLRWRNTGDKLKEEIVLNQAGRDWITANAPPITPLNETYFGFVFQLDPSDIPRWVQQDILQDINGDFDDSGGKIETHDELGRMLGFMPIDNVSVNSDDTRSVAIANGLETYKQPLRKRIWKDGSNFYLLLGIRADKLNQMQDGDLVFDPTWGYTGVQANADDGELTDVTGSQWEINGSFDNRDYVWDGSGGDNGSVAFSWQVPAIPASSRAIAMYVRVYSIDSSGDTEFNFRVQDVDPASAVIWSGSNLPGTGASWVWQGSALNNSHSASTWYYGESDTYPTDLGGAIDNLHSSYGDIELNDRINIALYPNIDSGGDYFSIQDFNEGSNEAELYIEWTEVVVSTIGTDQDEPDIATWEDNVDGLARDDTGQLVEAKEYDEGGLSFDGKDSTLYSWILEGTGAGKHDGTWGSGATITNAASSGHVIYIAGEEIEIRDLEIVSHMSNSANSDEAIRFDPNNSATTLKVTRCLLQFDDSSGSDQSDYDGIYIYQSGNIIVKDTVIYNFHRVGLHLQNYSGGFDITILAVNCTIDNCGEEGGTYGACYNWAYSGGTQTYITKNCVGTRVQSENSPWQTSSPTFGGTNCAAEGDGDEMPNANEVINITPADEFTALGSDYSVKDINADIYDTGIGPSSDSDVNATDIIGNTRSGTTCDIGAFEFQPTDGVLVAPVFSSSLAGSITPSTILGSLLASPSALSTIASSQSPIIILGSISDAPGFVSAVTSSLAPDVELGSINIQPDGSTAISITNGPLLLFGSTIASPDVSYAVANSTDPTTILGSVSFEPSISSAITATIPPTTIQGSLNIQPDGSYAIASTLDPSSILGAITLTPAGVSALGSTQDPTIQYGSVVITVGSSTSRALSIDPSVDAGGNISFIPTPSSTISSSVLGGIVLGSTIAQPDGSFAITSTQDPAIILGSLTLTASATAVSEAVSNITLEFDGNDGYSLPVITSTNWTIKFDLLGADPFGNTVFAIAEDTFHIFGDYVIMKLNWYDEEGGSQYTLKLETNTGSIISDVLDVGVFYTITVSKVGTTLYFDWEIGSDSFVSSVDMSVMQYATLGSDPGGGGRLRPGTKLRGLTGTHLAFGNAYTDLAKTIPALVGSNVAVITNDGSLGGNITQSTVSRRGIISAMAPMTILGSTAASPSPATKVGNTIDPAIILGALNLQPQNAGTIANTSIGDIELSSMIITPNFSDAIAVSVDPTALEGAILLSPGVADAISSTIGPTTILGSLSFSPAVSDAIASVIDPTVILPENVLVVPAAITAVSESLIQETVLGSLIISPDGTYAIAQTLDPTVVFSGLQESVCISAGDGLSLVTDGFLIPCRGDGTGPEVPVPYPVIVRVQGIEGKINSETGVKATIRATAQLSGKMKKELVVIGKKKATDTIKASVSDKETIKGKVECD